MMRWRHAILGAFLLASLGANVYRLNTRPGASPRVPRPEASRDALAGSDEVIWPKISAVVPCPPTESSPPLETEEFDLQSRDEAWAPTMEDSVRSHLRAIDLPIDEVRVECRQSCCRLAVPDDIIDRLSHELQSSTGYEDKGQRLISFHARRIDLCFDRSMGRERGGAPERARERRELLEAAAADLARCRDLVTQPIDLVLRLEIDSSGSIQSSEREGEQSGAAAARCAEDAVRAHAEFAPAPHATRIYLFIQLDPTSTQ